MHLQQRPRHGLQEDLQQWLEVATGSWRLLRRWAILRDMHAPLHSGLPRGRALQQPHILCVQALRAPATSPPHATDRQRVEWLSSAALCVRPFSPQYDLAEHQVIMLCGCAQGRAPSCREARQYNPYPTCLRCPCSGMHAASASSCRCNMASLPMRSASSSRQMRQQRSRLGQGRHQSRSRSARPLRAVQAAAGLS